MTQPRIPMHGAVDLSALANRSGGSPGAGTPSAAAAPPGVIIDVTEATFQAKVIDQSMTVPVVIDLWADWCGPCKQLSPVLERLAAADGGRWVLAKIDVDAEQRIAAAFQVQSIPSVFAVLKGQPIPLFQGALPEAQVRQVIDQLLQAAAQNGVTGQVTAAEGADADEAPGSPAPEPIDPDVEAAQQALERGDYDAAAASYQRVLNRAPADAEAKAALIQVELLRRTEGVDPVAARAAAQQRQDDVDAVCLAADLDVLEGDPEAAFARLVRAVRLTSGPERERARAHLVDLFEAVGPDDPRVTKAGGALASALF